MKSIGNFSGSQSVFQTRFHFIETPTRTFSRSTSGVIIMSLEWQVENFQSRLKLFPCQKLNRVSEKTRAWQHNGRCLSVRIVSFIRLNLNICNMFRVGFCQRTSEWYKDPLLMALWCSNSTSSCKTDNSIPDTLANPLQSTRQVFKDVRIKI